MNLEKYAAPGSTTVANIWAWHERMALEEKPRLYLGASAIGHECDRYLWYGFRQCLTPKFSGRMLRLFETGNLEEARFVKELRGIGCEVIGDDEQIPVEALGGHFRGHLDGCCRGIPEAPKTWHVLEFKTHNAKSFADLQKKGAKESKPRHYAQMVVYMGLVGLDRALYLAKNKDNDDICSERIRLDAREFDAYIAKAERIITAGQPCERCATRPDDWRCKFCDAWALCWGLNWVARVALPRITCRTCCHATPLLDRGGGAWACERLEKEIGTLSPCKQHLMIPGVVPESEAVDAGDDWIKFKDTADGREWIHGNAAGQVTSWDLIAPEPAPAETAPDLGTDNLLLVDRYPPEDSIKVWDGPDADVADAIAGLTDDAFDGDPVVEDTADVLAAEYGQKFLVVVYKAHGHAAIWQGKE